MSDGSNVRWTHARPYVLFTFVIVAVDQWSKLAAWQVDSSVGATRNPSYALGIVDGPAHMLAIGSLATLAIFVTLVARWALRLGVSPLIPGLVIGGMVGNILDRIVLGSVRDFLVTPWVICNVADLAIAGGLVAFLVAFGWRMQHLRGMTAATSLYARTRS